MRKKNGRFELRASETELERWVGAATLKGLTLAAWMRWLAEREIDKPAIAGPAKEEAKVPAPEVSRAPAMPTGAYYAGAGGKPWMCRRKVEGRTCATSNVGPECQKCGMPMEED